MNVHKHQPPAVPPTTYSITDLSEDDVLFLRDLLGDFTIDDEATSGKLFKQLNRIVSDERRHYAFSCNDGVDVHFITTRKYPEGIL